MKKILLPLVALTFAVAANAFTLRLQNSDLSKNVDVTADENDVFGDGKVSAHLDPENNRIQLTLNNATIKSTNGQEALMFSKDATYSILEIIVKGTCTVEAQYSWAFVIEGGTMFVSSPEPTAVLNVSANLMAVNMKNDAATYLGNMLEEDAFTINITSTNTTNQAFFYGSGGSYKQSLMIYYAHVNFINPNNNPLTLGLNYLFVLGKMSNGVVVKDNMFKKDDAEYKGNLAIVAPYRIMFGDDYLYPGDEADIKPAGLTKGAISYNPATQTLTLDGVTLANYIFSAVDGLTIYLKGSNTINKSGSTTSARLWLTDHTVLAGDADADLTLSCGGNSPAISALEGLEIKGFQKLTTYGAKNGIVGSTYPSETNVLKLGVPVSLNCAEYCYPVMQFDDFVKTNDELELTYSCKNLIYSTAEKKFVDKDDNSKLAEYLAYEYPVYLEFYGTPVNALNMADIKIAGSEGKASYDRTTGKLTLNGFKNTTADPMNAIAVTMADLTVVLVGENEMKASADAIDVYNDKNLTIEGGGSVKLTSTYGAGIKMPELSTLTLCKGATVEATGWYGVKVDNSLMCTQLDPMDPYEISGDAASLVINNATLVAKTTESDSYYAAITGFTTPTLTDAALTATVPAGGSYIFGCNNMDALAGVAKDNVYVREATYTKQGATAIVNVAPEAEKAVKVLRDGQLLIIRDGKTYTVQGVVLE